MMLFHSFIGIGKYQDTHDIQFVLKTVQFSAFKFSFVSNINMFTKFLFFIVMLYLCSNTI
jgi:hypothetical protein